MNKSEVEDYLASERLKITKMENGKPDSLLRLYPEYVDKLKGNYCSSLEPYTKIWELVPFREVQIIHIAVELKNAHQFHEWYGVSVEDILALEKKGQAVVMVNLPATVKEPDFLDPILQEKFPTSRRLVEHLNVLIPTDEKSLSLRNEIVELFVSKSGSSVDTLQGEPDRVKRTTETLINQLLVLGEKEKLAEILNFLKINDIEKARRRLEFYRLYLTGPSVYSLGGFHSISWRSIENSQAIAGKSLANKVEFFSPTGAPLVKKLNLYQPASFSDALDKRHDYNKARKALSEFDASFNKNYSDQIPKLEEIESHFDELIKSYENRKKLVDVVFVGGAIASATVGIGFWPSLALTATTTIDDVINIICHKKPIHNSIVKLATPRGLRSFFDVYTKNKSE